MRAPACWAIELNLYAMIFGQLKPLLAEGMCGLVVRLDLDPVEQRHQ